MNFLKIDEFSKKATILVAPLDWGLGHATRCIPIIRELLTNDLEVIVAADGAIKQLLKQEFPNITFINLPGYHISYSRCKSWLALKIILQIPKILYRIFIEHQWLKKVVKQHSIDAIISDNRFGLYHSIIPSVYITHQLLIKTGSTISDKIAQKIHYWFIQKYTQCWVPDNKGIINAAGELSHPKTMLSNAHYIGCISRFEKIEAVEKKYDLLAIISGPEPQRSLFENILFEQLKGTTGNILFVRGLPGNTATSQNKFIRDINIVVKNHLTASELNEAMLQSKLVICRSGYTTIMDLIKLNQKAILIPTPGQKEQEYLADYLMQQKIFFSTSQENLSLTNMLEQANTFPFCNPSFSMEDYKIQINQFVKSL